MNLNKNIIDNEIKEFIINDIKDETKYDDNKCTEIFKMFESNINDDLKSIISQTDLDIYKSYNLYKKNNFNVVNSIIEYLDPEVNKISKVPNSDNLTDVQKKLSELRIIADSKDSIYENIKK